MLSDTKVSIPDDEGFHVKHVLLKCPGGSEPRIHFVLLQDDNVKDSFINFR